MGAKREGEGPFKLEPGHASRRTTRNLCRARYHHLQTMVDRVKIDGRDGSSWDAVLGHDRGGLGVIAGQEGLNVPTRGFRRRNKILPAAADNQRASGIHPVSAERLTFVQLSVAGR